jgi:hypothetical protein
MKREKFPLHLNEFSRQVILACHIREILNHLICVELGHMHDYPELGKHS